MAQSIRPGKTYIRGLVFLLSLGALECSSPASARPSGSPEGYELFQVLEKPQVPSLARDGSPLWEAWKKTRTSWIKISGSEKSFQRAEFFKPYAGVSQGWQPHSLSVSLSNQEVVALMNTLGSHQEDFKNAFSGVSESKLKLITDLLFSRSITLTRESLKDLKRGFDRPNPAPIEVKIPVSMGTHLGWRAWNVITDSWILVQVDSLEFVFKEKKIEFDPDQQILRLSLEMESADLKGPVKEIGEVSFFSKYMNTKYWIQSSYLERGRVSSLKIQVGLQILWDDEENLWKLQMVEPLKLLVPEGVEPVVDLRMKRTSKSKDAEQRIIEEVVEKPVPLTKVAQEEVEKTLDQTVKEALQSSFLRRSMGLTFLSTANPKLETQLGDLALKDWGVEVSFDHRLRWEESDFCLAPREANLASRHRASSSGKRWQMVSVFSGDETDGQGRWRLLSAGQPRGVKVSATPAFMDSLLSTILAQKEACLDGTLFLRRGTFVPKQSLRPLGVGVWDLSDSSIRLTLPFLWEGYERTQSFLREDFQKIVERSFQLSLGLNFKRESQRIEVEVLDETRWNEVSLGRDAAWILDLLKPMVPSWSDSTDWSFLPEGRLGIATPTAEFAGLKLVDLASQNGALNMSLEVGSWNQIFDSHFSKKENSPEVSIKAIDPPETYDLALSRVESGVQLSWQGNASAQFFSWRLRSEKDPNPRWSKFSRDRWVLLSVTPETRFEFQVKAMNVNYEIEAQPKVLEFFSSLSPAPDPNPAPAPLSPPIGKPAQPKESAGAPARMSSKGFFGCGLHVSPEGLSLPMSFFLLFCALLSLGFKVHLVTRK